MGLGDEIHRGGQSGLVIRVAHSEQEEPQLSLLLLTEAIFRFLAS